MGFGFTDLTPEGKKYFRELKKMTDMEIQVGFQGDQKYEDGTSIAQVAAVNEFGASDIPERPFMRQSFENHEGELQAACDAAQRLVSSGGSASHRPPRRPWRPCAGRGGSCKPRWPWRALRGT